MPGTLAVRLGVWPERYVLAALPGGKTFREGHGLHEERQFLLDSKQGFDARSFEKNPGQANRGCAWGFARMYSCVMSLSTSVTRLSLMCSIAGFWLDMSAIVAKKAKEILYTVTVS